MAAQAAAQQ
jgi:hypothetical protein